MREKERKVKHTNPRKKGVFKCWAFLRTAAYNAVPLLHVCSELIKKMKQSGILKEPVLQRNLFTLTG